MMDTGLTLLFIGAPLCLIPMLIGSAFPPRQRRMRIVIVMLAVAGFLLAMIGFVLTILQFF